MCVHTNDHDIGHSLGELSILSENLLSDLGKQSGNNEIVHILAKGVSVEHFRQLAHSSGSRKEGAEGFFGIVSG